MSCYSFELPYAQDAAAYYAVLHVLPESVWLDSAGRGRYDILSAAPHQLLVLHGNERDAFSWVRDELGAAVPAMDDVPFAGGALGYWSYDLARTRFDVPDIAQDAECLPHMVVGIYDWALVIDHQHRRARLVSHLRYPETAAFLSQLQICLLSPAVSEREKFKVHGRVHFNLSPPAYAQAYAQIQYYLQAGDCYQINLAQRFCVPASGDALDAYLALRAASPAPYSAFVNFSAVQILCASPERFLRVENGCVETKPIKGTRPRSPDAVRDKQLAEELAAHPKDRAENLMIVDLLRNDLGKNCVPGSVCVPKLFEVESYAQVHHLVSTVQGKLAQGQDALQLLSDCFPGGSITGAPKQRAMHIIEQLEPQRRGVYCGVIGYVGFDGNMDSNIAIRTLVYSNHEIRGWAGGGIVADSQCAAEYQETLDKAAAMLGVLAQFSAD